ncbi:hypothetical protein NHX12_014161 [Muraenolepis orangiensis]|uniref:Perilipin n=1 Tax=Muraenolepis orangiensis TaxID=630683 RepID=A0A9Q0DC02_9TELE|nr:hypothetical protein NHX12_014161 [Muraenolepis orangiensis]
MAAAEVVSNQSAVERVTSLPLVSSTYGLVCSVYRTTRDHNPYLRTVCQAAEQGVRAITSVAMTTALPIIGRLEPQLARANSLACKGLDRIQGTLPILQQPSDRIVANAKGAVSSATGAVKDARVTVAVRLSGAVDRTRAVVSGGVDRALSTSENLMEQYLPLCLEEVEPEGGPASEGRSCYVRLGSLSSRFRRRAYSRALARVREAKRCSSEAISRLPHTVDLMEYARRNLDGANRKLYDSLSSLVERRPGLAGQRNGLQAPADESRSLTRQLQTTCSTLASGLQGLPGHIQREALLFKRSASRVYGELPEGVLAGGRARLGQMKRSLDHILDYLVNNTPLNWMVGPFYPRLPPQSQEPEPGHAAQSPSIRAPSPAARDSPDPSCPGPETPQGEVWGLQMTIMDSQQYLS